ncbi:MAG: thiamine pyrophosphate-dependent enzyme [Chloroflexota bacterium]
MSIMNGGQALIQSLVQGDITTVFGLPGAGQYEGIDALYTEPRIRYISVRHEQATTYMADGYARVSGDIAAALVVPGPGLFNALSGVATAYATSTPLLLITGVSHHRQKGVAYDDSPWLQGLTKWVGRANQPGDIPHLVQEAIRQLRTGRPRPVALEISSAVFAAVEDVQLLRPKVSPVQTDKLREGESGTVEPEGIEEAAQRLIEAKRPVIWAGGGIMRADAAAATQQLAEALQIPVVTTRQGKGTLPETHPLCLGMAETRYVPLGTWLEERDLILAIGTSRDFTQATQQIIKIDVDEVELGQADHILNIHANACWGVEALIEFIERTGSVKTDGLTNPHKDDAVYAEVQALKAARFNPVNQLQPQWDFMNAIRNALPKDGILVQGMNQMGYYSRNYFAASAPSTYLTSSSHGTLGCAFPLALGAKVAKPDQAVVALSGDGGFLYCAQELATAVQYGINVVVIVFNDNAYGNVLRAQMEEFDGHVLGTQLHNPDFVQLAQTYGARGTLATDANELHRILSESIDADGPTVIEVPVGMMKREY